MTYALPIALSILAVIISIIAQYHYNRAELYKEISKARFSHHTDTLIVVRNILEDLNVDPKSTRDIEELIARRLDLDEGLEIKFDAP